MSYYKACPHCGAHLDPGERCDCIESLRDQAKDAIMSLTNEECKILLAAWNIGAQHPELTPEECVKRAARGVGSTLDGKAEQVLTANVHASIVH